MMKRTKDPRVGTVRAFEVTSGDWSAQRIRTQLPFVLASFLIMKLAVATPQVVRLDGTLFDNSGNPLSGVTASVQVSAFSASTGGSALWTSSSYSVVPSDGRFTVNLDTTAAGGLVNQIASLGATTPLWFEISYSGNIIRPRFKAKGTMFALSAASADSLSGVTASSVSINALSGVTGAVGSYLNGLTANVQTQLNSKGNGAATTALTGFRNRVLSGNGDANGFTYLSAVGGSLAVTMNATAIPVSITFADGFDPSSGQPSDYLSSVTADVASAWSSLTASSTVYLYIDRNTSTGALTYGFSAYAPRYEYAAPSAPSTDQHWFDLSTYKMKRYAGSAWNAVQRVFVGYAVLGTTSVTRLVTYRMGSEMAGGDGGVTTCPSGYSRIGEYGRRGSFCISSVMQASAPFLTAQTNCWSQATSTGDRPQLCTLSELYIACSQGVSSGQTALTAPTGSYQFVSDTADASYALGLGSTACTDLALYTIPTTTGYQFRCCVR